MRTLVGVDGAKAGWVAVVEAAGEIRLEAFATFAALANGMSGNALIVVDMPIGLPDHCFGGRGPERLVRQLLGRRRSSVFEVPSRGTIYLSEEKDPSLDYTATYNLAKDRARATSTPPRAFARQGFGLFPKIREVDGYLREDSSRASRVIESHPELAFWRLNEETPLEHPKRDFLGEVERIELLAKEGFARSLLTGGLPPKVARDDLLDACAMLTVARRFISGTAMHFPDPPERDAYGLPVAISC